jgi:hypothetical protein
MSGKVSNGESKIVLLHRAGSGDCIIQPPSEQWLDAVRLTCPGHGKAYEPYTDFRVAFVPESKGYGDMPGCSIVILPGDDGAEGFERSKRVPLEVPTSKSFLESPHSTGMFGISTNFADLKALHAALGEVIASIEANVAAKTAAV